MKKKKKAKAASKKKKAKPAKKKTVRAKVKVSKKKPVKKKKAPKKKAKAKKVKASIGVVAPPNSRLIGRVQDYYAKIGVIALTLQAPVSVGARLHVMGHTTNFEQTLESMQIDHAMVTAAKANDPVGIKVTARARGGDYVFLILS